MSAIVQYIKLGRGGEWAPMCLGLEHPNEHQLMLGFWTDRSDMLDACYRKDWDKVSSLIRSYRRKPQGASVSNDMRQIRALFDDDGTTLWFTFHQRRMFWGYRDPTVRPVPYTDPRTGRGGSVHAMRAPWCSHEAGRPQSPLLLDDLAGHLGQVTQYRGTICSPAKPSYVLDRIHGRETTDAAKARQVIATMEDTIASMMRELTPYDFEALVEMAFLSSGWRRLSGAGGTEEGIDLVLERSSLGASGSGPVERVGVQVKSRTSTPQFNTAAQKLGTGTYDRVLVVYHSGTVDKSAHPDVELVNADALASMVLDAGLTRWLYRKIR